MSGSTDEEQLSSARGASALAAIRADIQLGVTRISQGAPISDPAVQLPNGVPHLLCELAHMPCLVPLGELRGVLTEMPKVVRFPFAPEWMLGVFLFRRELVPLIDPLPMLLDPRLTAAREDLNGGLRMKDTARYLAEDGPQANVASAVVAGIGDRTLAMRVNRVSSVVYVTQGDTYQGSNDSLAETTTNLIQQRYVAGIWAPTSTATPHLILALQPLLDDIVSGLEEGADA